MHVSWSVTRVNDNPAKFRRAQFWPENWDKHILTMLILLGWKKGMIIIIITPLWQALRKSYNEQYGYNSESEFKSHEAVEKATE